MLAHKDAKQALLVFYRSALNDPEESVRTEAIESMGELDLPAAVTVLEDLADHGPDAASRAEALETLVDKSPERALALVDRWIKAGSGSRTKKS
jgi:HEAT repeat protein